MKMLFVIFEMLYILALLILVLSNKANAEDYIYLFFAIFVGICYLLKNLKNQNK